MGRPRDPLPQTAPLWTRDYLLLDVVSFLFFTSFYLLTSTFQFFVLAHGADMSDLGLVLAVLTLTAVIARPWIGPFLDQHGRKPALAIGLVLMAIANLLYLVSDSLFAIIAVRIVQGVGWAMATTAASTMISDVAHPSRRGEAMGFYSNFTDVAMAVGPFLGVYVTRGNIYGWLFVSGAVLAASGLAFLYGVRERFERRASNAERNVSFRLEPRAVVPSLVLLTATFAYAGVLGYLPTFVKDRGLTHLVLGVSDYAYFYIAYALTLLLSRGLWGKLYDRCGKSCSIIPGVLLMIVGMIMLPSVHDLLGMVMFAVCFGLGFGAVQPATLTWAVARTPQARWGQAVGTYYTAFDGGMAIAYSSLGWMIQRTSYRIGFWVTAALLAFGLMFYLVFIVKEQSASQKG